MTCYRRGTLDGFVDERWVADGDWAYAVFLTERKYVVVRRLPT